jgi:hypothetical protein
MKEYLAKGAWGLARAKDAAAKVIAQPALAKPLLQALTSNDGGLRERAADTARRITERQPELLASHANKLINAFAASEEDNWRTRAHLGMVAARVANTRAARQRVAGLLMPLYYDPSNVVRCTAIEGLGILARYEPGLRRQFEAIAEESLATGTLAMKNRAHHGLARLYRR